MGASERAAEAVDKQTMSSAQRDNLRAVRVNTPVLITSTMVCYRGDRASAREVDAEDHETGRRAVVASFSRGAMFTSKYSGRMAASLPGAVSALEPGSSATPTEPRRKKHSSVICVVMRIL